MYLAALNTEIVKYTLLVMAFPVWMPFFKALYTELNDALAEEGGLFGRTPTQREIEVLATDPNRSKSPLVNREFDPSDPTRRGAHATPGAAPQRNAPPQKSRASSAGAESLGFSKPRGARGFSRKDRGGA